MTLKDAAQLGNEESVRLCTALLEKLGPTGEYECTIASIATSLFFHIYRLRLSRSKEKAIELLRTALDDVADNILKRNGHKIRFTVEEA